MTNQNDDPLIAEIEKMIAKEENPEYRNDCKEDVLDYLRVFHKLVIADRARQQAEKEKMIAELKDKIHRDEYGGEVVDLEDVIAIIQGKEQKE